MPYITREDGERFVIPSYRDVLSAKKPALLKKEIFLLSSSYGEYLTLHRKNTDQFEAAFSPDSGYLLGETVWQYFNRPLDLIYCEAIANTTEAILVIVKGGSVYLDGTFPVDSIPDELVIFRTQQNQFEIYLYGNVPISNIPDDLEKFSLDPSSVKSFTILDAPAFPQLRPIKAFQLRLIDAVLKSQGIGVFPVKKLAFLLLFLGLFWMVITYFTLHKEELPVTIATAVNPYQLYIQELTSPDPVNEMQGVIKNLNALYSLPGWYPSNVTYSNGTLDATVSSNGIRINTLYAWIDKNQAKLTILPGGFHLTMTVETFNRAPPTAISAVQDVVAELIDRLSYVLPGNAVTLVQLPSKAKHSEVQLTISFTDLSLATLALISEQLRNLPLVLSKVNLNMNNGVLSGSIAVKALGN